MKKLDYCNQCANGKTRESIDEHCHYCEGGTGQPSLYQPRLVQGVSTGKQIGKFEQLGRELGELTDEKNEAYGDSVMTSAEAFKLLYPDGIRPEQYSDALLMVRTWDKMKRIATRKDAFGENPWRDINGYSLLGAMKDGGK